MKIWNSGKSQDEIISDMYSGQNEYNESLLAYWTFDDPYHLQSGIGPMGDLPGEFKYLYSGAVLRDAISKQ
jgi:hypothetical protein